MRIRLCLLITGLVLLTARSAVADAPNVKVDTIVEGLSSPMGVAVRPGTNELYVSDSGAGQIVRATSDQPGKATPVITGFATRPFPSDAKFNVGPLGLAFMDRQRLVVGAGGEKDGRDVAYVFVPPTGDSAIGVDQAKQKLGPLPDKNHTLGFIQAVATTPYAIFLSTRGDDAGWIARAIAPEGVKAAEPQLAINTKSLAGFGGPAAMTVSRRGELVVAQVGDFDKPTDTRLAFYDPKPKQGRLLLVVATGLKEISGLAYGTSGSLYALAPGWSDGKDAGLYRLDATLIEGKMGVKAVKLVALDRPTGLAVTADGTLYVTVLGPVGAGEKSGKLLKLSGSL